MAKEVNVEICRVWHRVDVQLFGSELGPGLHAVSDLDLDLALEGLSREALLEVVRRHRKLSQRRHEN